MSERYHNRILNSLFSIHHLQVVSPRKCSGGEGMRRFWGPVRPLEKWSHLASRRRVGRASSTVAGEADRKGMFVLHYSCRWRNKPTSERIRSPSERFSQSSRVIFLELESSWAKCSSSC